MVSWRRWWPALAGLALMLSTSTPGAAQQTGRAGDFDYYALVLSWSPTYCAGEGAGRGDPQCAPGRPYSFVLHGLWPQYARGWPENCRTDFNPFVPRPVIDGMLDIMPSPRLVIHEYRKHGTCSGLDPKSYFELSRRLFDKIKVPEAFRAPDRPITTSPGDVVRQFTAANPGLTSDMMGVVCGRPDRLREVRICFGRDGQLRNCGRNEEQGRLCRAQRIVLPPVRAAGSARGARPEGGPPMRSSPLPLPTAPPAPQGERRI